MRTLAYSPGVPAHRASTWRFVAVRVAENGLGGHAHNDQLCLELNLDGEDLIVDPGSYIYTAIPSIRNQYRSVTAHFVPTSPAHPRNRGGSTAVSSPCLLEQRLYARSVNQAAGLAVNSPRSETFTERSRFSPIAL